MLSDGQVPKYVPNWWNPYAPNIGQKDPQRKQKLINTVKLVFVVITMLGGAVLALTINVFVRNAYGGQAGPSIGPQDQPSQGPSQGRAGNNYPKGDPPQSKETQQTTTMSSTISKGIGS